MFAPVVAEEPAATAPAEESAPPASTAPAAAAETAPVEKSFTELWDGLLKRHVSRGTLNGIELSLLDYGALKADPDWPKTLAAIAAAEVPKDRAGKIAFWCNAYNVMTAKVVLTKYPKLESINDLSGIIGSKVWDQEAGVVAGETRTLNQIEHDILRKTSEPRIHAAIVCASVSCPDLRAEAFVAERLDAQLEEQMRAFLANPAKGAKVDAKGTRLDASKIFDWFAEDFESSGGALNYIAERLPQADAAKVGAKTRLKFLDYDWSLNDAARAKSE